MSSCWDDILADDVRLIEEYPVGCLRAVLAGIFFLFCVRIVHGSDGLRMKDSKCSFDVAVEINIFRKMDDCDMELKKRTGT